MKTNVEVELLPFMVPTGVSRVIKDGEVALGFHVSEIDASTLEKMCDDFRNSVFENAKKERPPQPACNCKH